MSQVWTALVHQFFVFPACSSSLLPLHRFYPPQILLFQIPCSHLYLLSLSSLPLSAFLPTYSPAPQFPPSPLWPPANQPWPPPWLCGVFPWVHPPCQFLSLSHTASWKFLCTSPPSSVSHVFRLAIQKNLYLVLKGLACSFHSCENLLELSRTGLDWFKTKLMVPNLENNKYSSNVYNNSTSYI